MDNFELGKSYRVTYSDGNVIEFMFIGGPDASVCVLGQDEFKQITEILGNYALVVPLTEK